MKKTNMVTFRTILLLNLLNIFSYTLAVIRLPVVKREGYSLQHEFEALMKKKSGFRLFRKYF